MKKILISAALLLAFVPCLVMARTVNDTLTIVKITAKIITKNGKPFEGKRYINFHLNDGRVIVLEDKEKDDASPDKIMSDKGRIYQDGIEEGVTGFLSEENAVDFAEAIEDMISDMDKLKEVGKNAGEKIYLSWTDSVAAAYERYENLCKNWPYPLPCKGGKAVPAETKQ